jgi:sterol 3beta-glucosyltransferase
MKITLFVHGTRGDVWPMVALGWHLAAHGHDVTVAVPDEYRAFTERAGLRTAPLPFDMAAWLATAEGQHLLHAGGLPVMRGLQREFTRHADALDEAFETAAQYADALVATYMTWDRAQAMGDRLQIPLAIVYPWPCAPSREYSSLVLTRGRLRSRLLRLASHELTDRIWSHGAAKSTNTFRRKLDLPASPQSTLRRLERARALGLHTLSPNLFPRPTDWPDELKMTGAWLMPDPLRDSVGEDLPADLEAWLNDGDPPLFLGFGSMPVPDPEPLLKDIISVTTILGRRAILSENCVSPQAADTLPGHLRVVGAVDHDRLFPCCSAVVHHGGAGSTSASVRAGRPTMICSVMGDQPWWGEHMKRLGVGTHIPLKKLDRDTLESELRMLLDPKIGMRARALGAAIQAEGDGLPEAARLLEDWLVVAEPTPTPTARRPARRKATA